MCEVTVERGEVVARYVEDDRERVLSFERGARTVTIAQNVDGYATVAVRSGSGDELERYYGLEMALDHAAELLDVEPDRLPVPDEAADMGL